MDDNAALNLITQVKESLEREMRQGFAGLNTKLDASLVNTAMTLRHETWLKDQRELIGEHSRIMVEHGRLMAEIDRKLDRLADDHGRLIMEIDRKLDRLADLILHSQGGNGK